MTLLHQAAQKAVEALTDILGVEVMAPEGGREEVQEIHCIARTVLASLESALQQQPEPVAQIDESKLPPRPAGHNGPDTDPDSPLVRYGRAKPESGVLLEPMADGYWTPWHIANELLRAALQHQEEPSTAVIPPAPLECETEDEKTAFSFGYWQGLHAARKGKEVPREPVAHFPIIYAILRPALSTGNITVRQHAERLAEVLEGDQLAAVRELLDRQPATSEPARVIHAASPSTTRQQEVGSDIVEAIACQWDGCMAPMFDATGNPTDAIDIGATIRADGIPAAAPSPLQREVGSGYEFAGGFIQNRNANGSTRWEQVSKQYENDADVVKLYRAAAPSTPEKAGGVTAGVKVPAPSGHIMSPPIEDDADLLGGGEHLNPEKFVSKADIERAHGVTPPAATFTGDELVRFYEEWEFNEEDPGEAEFIELVREVERRVLQRTRGVQGASAPSNEELEALWEQHAGHPADFAADVLERWGGWPEGSLGYGGTAGVSASVPHPLPAQANDGGEHG